jgi:hypothetical protein
MIKITKIESEVSYVNRMTNRPRFRVRNIARLNEIPGWEGVGNRQLLCFFKA